MLTSLFLQILATSIKSIPLIGFIILSNIILQKRINPGFFTVLWILLFMRLIIPLPLPVRLETLDRENRIAEIISYSSLEDYVSSESTPYRTEPSKAHYPHNSWYKTLSLIWITGSVLIVSLQVYHSFRLRKLLKRNRTLLKVPHSPIPVLESSSAPFPFILGIVHPQIFIPEQLWEKFSEKERKYVLDHELGHYYRKDILIGWICFLVLAVHWFNPFVWFSYFLIQSNKEMACDHCVTKDLPPGDAFEYARTLLMVSELGRSNSMSIFSAGLTGKYLLQRRIEMIVLKKKRTVLATVLLLVFSLLMALVFLVDPLSLRQDSEMVLFNELSQLRTSTSDDQPHHVSIKMQLLYDGSNKDLEKELLSTTENVHDVTREYLNSKTAEQLITDVQIIKRDIIDRINSILSKGEILDVLFKEYKVFEY